MTDREKVIQGLKCCIKMILGQHRVCDECPYDEDFNCLGCSVVLRQAIALLKEPEIVRCKDCIYYNSEPDSHGDHCDKIHWSRGLNWFCADGERR